MPKRVRNPKAYERNFDLPYNCVVRGSSYSIRYTHPETKKSTYKVLGKCSLSSDEIRKRYHQFYKENPDVLLPSGYKQQDMVGTEPTFKEVVGIYLESSKFKELSNHTQKNTQNVLGYLSDRIGHVRIGALTKKALQPEFDKMNQNTANDYIKHFRKVVRWSYEMEYHDNRIFEKIKPYKIKRKFPRPDFSDLISFVRWKHVPMSLRCANLIAYITGLRMTDIIKLKFEQFGAGNLSVDMSKVNLPLSLKPSRRLMRIVALLKRRNKSEYLIERNGKPFSIDGFSKYHTKYMKQALDNGIVQNKYTFRTLRNLHANRSKNIKEAQERLGHTSERMTKRYLTIPSPIPVLDDLSVKN